MLGSSNHKTYTAFMSRFFDFHIISKRNLRCLLKISCAWLYLVSSHAYSLDYAISGFVEGAYESNVINDNRNELSDVQQDIGITIKADQLSGPITLSTDYRATHTDHKQDFSDDSSEILGFSEIRFLTLKNRVAWTIDHQSKQTFANQQIERTPDNEVLQNIYRTKLEAKLPIVSKVNISSSVTAVKSDFDGESNAALLQNTDPDSERFGGSISLNYQPSSLSAYNIGSQYSRSNRDDTSINQELISYSLGFSRALRSIQYGVSAGYNEISFGGTDNGGGTFNANLLWESAQNTVQITARQEKTSSSLQNTASLLSIENNQNFNNQNNLANINLQDNLADINLDSTIDISSIDTRFSSSALCSRCNTELTVGFERTEYESSIELSNGLVADSSRPTENLTDAWISLGYSLSKRQAVTLGFGYSYVDIDTSQNPALFRSFERYNIQLNYRTQITNRLSISLSSFFTEQLFDDFSDDDNKNSGFRISIDNIFLQKKRAKNRR